RVFSPVILFHDHQFVKDGSGGLEHIHIPYGDPHYGRYIETHKKRIHLMLEHNERFWTDIRAQQPPPLQPSPSNGNSTLVKRRRGNLPKAVTAILREWLSRHKKHPYPTEDEKAALARQTNLTLNQISNWFINARRRILQPMLQKERQARMLGEDEDHGTLDILPYAAGGKNCPL
ncbi:Homeodomain-like protein, partial [Fennellomyces sp. T-0311]